VSARPDGPAVRVIQCADETDEVARTTAAVRALDPGAVRGGQVAVLARTHGQLATVRAAMANAGVPFRQRIDGPGSPYAGAVSTASRLGSSDRLRSWAHDVLDGLDDATLAAPPTIAGLPGESPADDEWRHRCQVAEVALEFLREHPLGNGAEFRTWLGTGRALGVGDAPGLDVLTFHAAKGREWRTVFVTGVESGLVPHRSATTRAGRAEEARLLYVALTRATDELVVSWAARRGGYQRRRSPLLEGYQAVEPVFVPPPHGLVPSHEPDPTAATYDALVRWRAKLARANDTVPEAVCAGPVLRTMATTRPRDADELAALTGVGAITARRWWPALAPILHASTAAV
jgi:DNA helicase-2/ATP-dependent DNA helicase PcrA